MNEQLSTAEHQLLERVLTGDLATDAPEISAAAAANARFAEELAGLSRLAGTLDQAAAEEKAVRSATDAGSPALTARLQTTLRDLAAKRPAAARVRRPGQRGGRMVAAAALVLLALTLWLLQRGTTDVPEQWLGSAWARDLVPDGEFREFTGFSWQGRLPQDGAFEVLVFAQDAAGKETEVARSDRLTGTSWQPPPELTLPARFRWEVLVHGPGGFLRRATVEAWRAPR